MNFELDEEQLALQGSLARLLDERYSFEKRRAIAATPQGHDPGTWAMLSELGLTALAVPEAHGGFGRGARDLLPAMQEFGRVLSLEPFLASAVLGVTALAAAADQAQQARLLPQVATGALRLAWAHDETAARHAPLHVDTRAVQAGGHWLLEGTKTNVVGGSLAHWHLVSARTDTGLSLFLVDAAQPGLQARHYRLVDDTPATELRLQGTRAELLAGGDAAQAIARTQAAGIAAACADMLGSAQAAFDLAMGYLNTRRQFGRLIGENQALRHRAADMLVSLEMARSMAMAAAVAADDPDADESQRDLHRAKLSVGRHARAVAHGAIQCHGGIGMTEEYAVGHCLRRIHVLDQLFGDADAHAARLAAIS